MKDTEVMPEIIVIPDDISEIAPVNTEKNEPSKFCHLWCPECSGRLCDNALSGMQGGPYHGGWTKGQKWCKGCKKPICSKCVKSWHWSRKMMRMLKLNYNRCSRCKR